MVATWILSAVLLGAPQTVALYGADDVMARELQAALNPELWKVVPMEMSSGTDHAEGDHGMLAEAIQAFDSLMFEDVVPLLKMYRKQAEKRLLELDDMHEYLRASLYLARTWEVLGKQEAADKVLDDIARLQPDLSTLLERFPPGFRTRVAERASQLPPRRGSLRIESQPQRAEVWINGHLRGRTPLVVSDLPGGTHTVTTSLTGHRSTTRNVEITAGFGIGADATPELLEITLAVDAVGASEDVLSTLAEQRLPGAETTAAVRGWHRAQNHAVGVYVVGDAERTTLGLLMQEGAWRGPEPFPAGALATPPVRARIVRSVVDWLEHQVVATGEVDAVDAEPAVRKKDGGSKRVWLWTGVGAVVTGGITAAAIAASGPSDPQVGSVEISW